MRSPKFCLFALAVPVLSSWLTAGCGSSSATAPPAGVQVTIANTFGLIEAGSPAVLLTVTLQNDQGNHGVTWELSLADVSCSPGCGTLQPAAPPSMSAVYTPPAKAPLDASATITVRSLADARQVFVFNFQIVPPVSVSITSKFSSQTIGGPRVDLTATISNDQGNQGLTWTLTANGVDGVGCNSATACGTLTVDPAPSLTAHYTPPPGPPPAADASPTITASSVFDPNKKDSFTFNIVTPPISIIILNPFSSQIVGGGPVQLQASITNDFTNAGLTWTITANGASCNSASACGTLTPAASPSLSASYTPPATVPSGASAMPTITASSVFDPTKQASFQFSLVTAASLFKGNYAFLLRGYDSPAHAPLALAGSLVADGQGMIAGGKLDLNDAGTVTSFAGPLSGTYTLDNSYQGIPRVAITISNFQLPNTTANFVLKCALSADGSRGKAIEFDNSLFLAAGTILRRDPTALAAANPAGSYAFQLDSDAPVNARIVEAGQFVLTMGGGGPSVTSGLADAGQANGPTAIIGPLSGVAPLGAPLVAASSSATSPDAASGRGTLTLSFPGNGANVGLNITNTYAYYVVSAQQLNLIEVDTGGIFKTVQAGSAQLQKPLTAASINSTGIVALTGMTFTNSVLSSNVIVGQLITAGGNSYSATFDNNKAGTALSPASPSQGPPTSASGSVGTTINGTAVGSFDPTTGRALLVNSPLATPFVGASVVYLYDSGKGFLIDITPANSANQIFNYAFSGLLTPQATGPFSIANDLSGNLIALSGGSSIPAVPNIDSSVSFDGPNEQFSALFDFTTTNASIGTNGQVPNFGPIGPDAFRLDDTSLGRGRMAFPGYVFGNFSAPSTDIGTFYLIGPNQFVLIEQSGFGPSGVLFFDPD